MKIQRFRLRAIVTAIALGLAAVITSAQGFPSKPMTLIVPFPPGGSSDILARALAEKLSLRLGQPVIVDNRPGAGATLGAAYVATAKPDGYTLLMGAVHHAIATSVYKNLSYDFEKSFTPITTVALVPNVLVINAKSPVVDVQGLIAAARAAKDRLAFGSNGSGTLQHLLGTQFAAMSGIDLLHVPYKGSAPLTIDLLGGQVFMSFDTITPVMPFIKSRKLRALAVTISRRSSTLPEVPTLDESGLKGFDQGTWFGVLAPAGTPGDVVATLNAEMVRVIQLPEFRKRMADIGAEPIGDSPAQMAAQIRTNTAKYAKLVKEANIAID